MITLKYNLIYGVLLLSSFIAASKIVVSDGQETPGKVDFITTRNVVTERDAPSILFADEDNNYNITSGNKTASTDRFGVQPHVLVSNAVDLFPKPPVCGPIKLTHKIYNGQEAELGEFPWLVNLEYRTPYNDLVILCAGNIINHRFVLTAAQCVTGVIEKQVGKLESLRAGEHNTQTDIDCDESTCLPPFQRFIVIKTIVHGNYTPTRKQTLNDIALLKTDRKMIYSVSIAPICMPDIMIAMPSLTNGTRLTEAGWGVNVNSTYVKRIVDLRYVDMCPLEVQPAQMCAGGSNAQDSCTGESGAALCRLTNASWVVEGIVSYGPKCGTLKPSVYTRVRSFLEWIHANVDEN